MYHIYWWYFEYGYYSYKSKQLYMGFIKQYFRENIENRNNHSHKCPQINKIPKIRN